MKSEGNIKIFIVDDDPLFLRSMEHHLRQKLSPDMRIHAFSTGEECIKKLEWEPDIILLDYLLNEAYPYASNGGEVMRVIKRTRPDTKVIILSSQEKMDVALDLVKSGAYAYVIKNDLIFLKTVSTIREAIQDIKRGKQRKEKRKYIALAFAAITFIGAAVYVLSDFLN